MFLVSILKYVPFAVSNNPIFRRGVSSHSVQENVQKLPVHTSYRVSREQKMLKNFVHISQTFSQKLCEISGKKKFHEKKIYEIFTFSSRKLRIFERNFCIFSRNTFKQNYAKNENFRERKKCKQICFILGEKTFFLLETLNQLQLFSFRS